MGLFKKLNGKLKRAVVAAAGMMQLCSFSAYAANDSSMNDNKQEVQTYSLEAAVENATKEKVLDAKNFGVGKNEKADKKGSFLEWLDEPRKGGLAWWEYAVNIPAAYVSTVLLHESGHYVLAKAFGARDVRMYGPGRKAGSIAMVSYKQPFFRKFSTLQRVSVHAGGVLATTAGSLALEEMLRQEVVPEKLKAITATASLMMMIDRWRYVLLTVPKVLAGYKSTSNDIMNITKHLSSSKRTQGLIYGLLAAETMVEIYLRWDEVEWLYATAIGEKAKPPKRWQFTFDYDGDTAYIGFGGSF